jgi:hypothetical protein
MTDVTTGGEAPFRIHPTIMGIKTYGKNPRDSQRSKLYAWERSGALPSHRAEEHRLTLEECAALAARIYQDHRLKTPKVKDGRRRRGACYQRYGHTIRLPRWARCKWVVIHECAHGMVGEDEPAHGARFCYLYAYLLWRYFDQRDYRAAMAAAGLKIENFNA